MPEEMLIKGKDAKSKTKLSKKPRRAKTFTGCWTCRSRKVKCDLQRPSCSRCEKSGLPCGGYDIKLRWSNLVKFDNYGVQINANSKLKNVESHYQRRNIDFVKYDEEYIYHEDMDDELSTLHAPPNEMIADGKTWIIKKFGVFRGTDNIDNSYPQRKRRRKQVSPNININSIDTNLSNKDTNTTSNNKLSRSNSLSPSKPIEIRDSSKSNMMKSHANTRKTANDNVSTVSPNSNTTSKSNKQMLDYTLSPLAMSLSPSLSHSQHTNLNTPSISQSSETLAEKEKLLNDSSAITKVKATSASDNHNNNTNDNNDNNTIEDNQSNAQEHNSSNHLNSTAHNTLTNIPGFEYISNELRDDFLLSTLAQQGGSNLTNSQIDFINDSFGGNFNLINDINHNDNTAIHNINLPNNNNNVPASSPLSNIVQPNSNTSAPSSEQSINQLLRYLFQNTSNANQINNLVSNQVHSRTNSTASNNTVTNSQNISRNNSLSSKKVPKKPKEPAIVPITQHFTQFKCNIPLDDTFNLNSPNNDSTMPKSIIEILPSKINIPNIVQLMKKIDPSFHIPQTGIMVHGLTRFLLNYYMNHVADLMTVIPIEKNPWKDLYFPRAINAMGELVALGTTSNSKNSLLNALLAVSCFNLKSKCPKNTVEQSFFLNLGIEFRLQASGFLKLCLKETVDKERYKDVLTAILSMNSIDVVWGTMTDCQRHLTICEDFIEKRMKKRPKLSEKARTLHRIFSFLKLVQDSTALDKVRDKEIVFFEKNDSNGANETSGNVPKHPPIRATPTTCGSFRESVDEDGKIRIQYINEEVNTPTSTGSLTPPMFSTIASISYYNNDEHSQSNDILGTDALYGLPNSLILLFSDCVRIARHTEYYKLKYISVPREFNDLTIKFEKRLLKWKPEWKFYQDDDKKVFISDMVEAVYHHTMSFYFGLVIYYFTMARSLDIEFLQSYVTKVLKHLKEMNKLIEIKKIQLVPLIWQGFVAGCASTELETQNEFKDWAAKLAESGMGSYWGARQVMYEVWRRRKMEEPADNWYAVYKDWEMNLMLS